MNTERPELATPALNGLLDFWLGKCADGKPPVASTISPAELRPWKDNIVIFEIVGDDDFVYSYYGKALEQAWGHSRLGHTLDALPDAQRRVVRNEYDMALRERLPISRLYTGDFDGVSRAFERLVLPLSSDGAVVDKLLVCAFEIRKTAAADAPEDPADNKGGDDLPSAAILPESADAFLAAAAPPAGGTDTDPQTEPLQPGATA